MSTSGSQAVIKLEQKNIPPIATEPKITAGNSEAAEKGQIQNIQSWESPKATDVWVKEKASFCPRSSAVDCKCQDSVFSHGHAELSAWTRVIGCRNDRQSWNWAALWGFLSWSLACWWNIHTRQENTKTAFHICDTEILEHCSWVKTSGVEGDLLSSQYFSKILSFLVKCPLSQCFS